MKSNIRAPLAAVVLLSAFVSGAAAQAVVSTGESLLEPRLLVGERRADGTREAGLELTVRQGWKTYWRNPGEAGVAPSFDWSGSDNLADVTVEWPVPEVFESFGLRTAGYSGTVVLPLRLVAEHPEEPIDLALEATFGVCREVCVLEEVELGFLIPPEATGPAAERIAAASAARLPTGEAAGVEELSCELSGSGRDRTFRARIGFDRPLADPYVALEAPERGWFHGTETLLKGDTVEIVSTLSLESANTWIDRSSIAITVLDPAVAAEIRGCEAG